MEIAFNESLPDEDEYSRGGIYLAHPIVVWLARFFKFSHVGTCTDDPRQPTAYLLGDTLIMSAPNVVWLKFYRSRGMGGA